MTIVHQAMPDPLQLVDYGYGVFGPAMWHYCDEDVPWSSFKKIAEAHSYNDVRRVRFYEDKALGWSDDADMPEIVRREEAGEDVLCDWIPTPPSGDGWILVARFNDEDGGPTAIYLRRKVRGNPRWGRRL